MKKHICIFLAVAMVVTLFGVVPVSAETSGTCGDNLTWVLDDDGTLTISGEGEFIENPDWGDVREKTKTIIIENGVTNIGMSAFLSFTNLTNITIPDTVKTIERGAFLECNSLQSITIPNGVTSIGYAAFVNCSSLTDITIPDSVTSIAGYAFDGSAYYGNEDNWTDGVLYIDNHLINAKNVNISEDNTEYEVKQGTVCIAAGAFLDNGYENNNCAKLTHITIPDSVNGIGDHAFYGCKNLMSISIPDGITNIGEYEFYGCSSLQSIIISDSVTSIGDWAFARSGITNITIPDGIENIGEYEFYYCVNLNDITMPDTIKSIGNSAFYYCNSLTDIEIPDSVTSIGNRAFYGCGNLTSISIPDNVTTVSEYMFYNCSNLTRVNLGSSVKEIATYAFYGCDNLTDVYYNDTFAKFQEVYIDNGFNNTNKPFIQATKHYVSDTPAPTDPTDTNSVIVMVEPVQGTAGSEVTVPIRIKNNPGISSFSFKISYNTEQLVPRGITKNADLPGSLTSNIEQSDDYASLEYVTAVWSNASDYSEDGELFYITFDLYPTASKGEYIPISISATGNIINQAYEEITATMKNGSVAIDFIYGDMYGDGILDNKDLVRMRQYLADWDITLTDEEKKVADVYADGIINNKDLVLLSQYFAEWNVTLGR